MINVVGVRFKKAGKIYYFDPESVDVQLGDRVIVETARGKELGEVVVPPKSVGEEDIVQPLKPIIRKATAEDLEAAKENCQLEKRAFKIGLEKINKHGLPMKLVDVEYTFDRSKIVFYFTADGRVDFRELVKDLAGVFRTRIELRQIGVRDEAKMLGGLGPCGRCLCCATFLGDFDPVSIRMAKEQNLSLNPTKISGICGRLMCCLRYEADVYKEAKETLPSPGDRVTTDIGQGNVVGVQPIKETVKVELADSDRTIEVPAADIEEVNASKDNSGSRNHEEKEKDRAKASEHQKPRKKRKDNRKDKKQKKRPPNKTRGGKRSNKGNAGPQSRPGKSGGSGKPRGNKRSRRRPQRDKGAAEGGKKS